MISRSTFCDELSSDWCFVVINDFPNNNNNCLIPCPWRLCAKMLLSGKLENLSAYCQGMSGNLFPPECGNPVDTSDKITISESYQSM